MRNNLFTLYAKALRFNPTSHHFDLGLPEISRSDVFEIDPEHCDSYNRLVGWAPELSALVHPNYVQTLSLPLQLDMMLDRQFPFKPLGLVHLANQISCNKLPEQHDKLMITTTFGQLYLHKKGWLFELVTDASLISKPKEQQAIQFKATSYYLARTRHDEHTSEHGKEKYPPIPEWINELLRNAPHKENTKSTSLTLRFDSNIGRKYAKISGDYNPIHLHPLTAKMLGFKKAIAHGMYSKALILSKLSKSSAFYKDPFTVNVAFMQPVVLPLETHLVSASDSETSLSFKLCSKTTRKSRVHLHGTLSRDVDLCQLAEKEHTQ